MDGVASWVLLLAGFAPTLTLSWLTARVTTGCGRVPIHFGITLAPDRFGPRWMAIVLIPVLQVIAVIFLLLVSVLHLPSHGDLRLGQIIAGLSFTFGQGLFYILLCRWRRGL